MLEILSGIVNAALGTFPPDVTPPEKAQDRKIYTWNTFVVYLDSLELSKNWQKYEEQGFRRCVVFDADDTIWKGDLSRSVVNKLAEERGLSEKALPHLNEALIFFGQQPQKDVYSAKRELINLFLSGEAFKIGQAKGLKKEEVLGKILELRNYLLADYSVTDLHKRTKEVFNGGFGGDVFVGIKELTDYLQKGGFEVYVLSAGVHQIVEEGVALAGLGIKRENVRGIKSTEVNGTIGEEIIPPVLDRKGKTEMAYSLCHGKPFIAFGDSVDSLDAGILESARIAVAVEPEKHQAKAAYEKDYIILDIERTVDGDSVDIFTGSNSAK